MNLHRYGEDGLCVQYQCVQCDRVNLIDTTEFSAGRYYNCSFCSHQWRSSEKHENVVAVQELEMATRTAIPRKVDT